MWSTSAVKALAAAVLIINTTDAQLKKLPISDKDRGSLSESKTNEFKPGDELAVRVDRYM